MKNKVLSLILALLMAASSASAVLADEAIADVDVEETAVVEEVAEAGQYDKAIAFLANYGIFKGISADDLGADLDVNRYQMALFVGRISTGWVDDSKWEDGPENWSEFTDISEGAVADYWGALSYANQKGIIEGYGNGKFGPYDGITYQNALTMVVRTLGYTGLDWPWGYIQKAVELGLTDGITDVAYTDELTRGETAQIIYNAMFAKTKAGSTLGLENFGVAFGWEKVIVTASDLNTFVPDAKDAEAGLKDETYALYNKSNKTDYGTGLVAFQILNDDGTLADDVYYVAASELGLVGDHADELAVGDAYYVLFEQDEDDNLVKVVAYESLLTETLVNAGKTNDEGEEVDYAIEAWLDEHTLVNKYSSSAYVNITASTKDEAMVFTANNSALKVVTGTDYAIAIDWATGDILVPADKDGDGDWKDDWKDYADNDPKNDYTKIEFELKYSWNDTLKSYYEVKFNRNVKDIDDFEDIAINWISEKEMEDLLAKYKVEFTKDVTGFSNAADSRLAKSAYASLKLFDTNLDGEAERGIYETYRLGKFEHKANNYNCGCGALDSYKISDVDTLAQAIAASKAKLDNDTGDVVEAKWTVREEGIKCKHSTERAWIVDDSELVLAVDEDGEETGYYDTAYVIYNYDKETGAIKVVKNITAGDDEDSFVATGVVRAYNVSKGTVAIGEETYHINNYDELLGNGFKYADDTVATKAVYGALLKSLFNQFVEYVVVDGELVHINAKDATKADVIIVDSYAGLSADGYIVVNGYKASELEYDQFRIGSYDGWMKGDYYYYLTDDKAAESFTKGTIYAITSYDKTEDVYYVNLSGAWDDNKYEVEDDVTLNSITVAEEDDGYMIVTINGKAKDVKMKSTDKYVIIPEKVDGRPFTSVIVYEGKLGEGWTVTGDVINTDNQANGTYIIVNAKTGTYTKDNTTYNWLVGFTKYNAYDAGIVLYLKGGITGADYDGTFAEDDTYLLGAVEIEATVIDLLTGKLDATRYATCKSLDEGHIYYTMGDVITEDVGIKDVDLGDIMEEIAAMYGETDVKNELAEYLVGKFVINETTAKSFFKQVDVDGDDDKDTDDARMWIGKSAGITSYQKWVKEDDGDLVRATYTGLYNLRGDSKYRTGIIGDVEYRLVDYTKDGEEIKNIEAIDWADFSKLVKNVDEYDYNVYFVYTVDGRIVCYICDDADKDVSNNDYNDKVIIDDEVTLTAADKAVVVAQSKNDMQGATITARVGYKNIKDEDGKITGIIVDGIQLDFAGNQIDAEHGVIEGRYWFFGYEDECAQDYVATITNDSAYAVQQNVNVKVVDTYDNHSADVDEDCNLIKSIYLPIVRVITDDATGKETECDFVIDTAWSSKKITFTIDELYEILVEEGSMGQDGVMGEFLADMTVVVDTDADNKLTVATEGVVEFTY